jgi:hypothetical protein
VKMQLGQSLVEFAVGAAAFLLLLLGVLTLSGYQEVQRRGSVAARQLSFESAWLSPDAVPQPSTLTIFQQHFGDPGLLDAVGSAHYLAQDDLRLSRHRGALPGLAGDAAVLLLAPLELSRVFTGRGIDLTPGGYVSGEVVAHVVTQPWTPDPFRGLDITLRQPYAIVSDPWNSGSARQVHEHTSSLVPTQRLAALATIWRTMAVPLSIVEPSLGKLCLGLIEPDIVPEDRLGVAVRPVTSGRACQ